MHHAVPRDPDCKCGFQSGHAASSGLGTYGDPPKELLELLQMESHSGGVRVGPTTLTDMTPRGG